MAHPNRLTEVLIQAQSSDHAARTAAELNLRAAEEQDFATFLRELSVELANPNSPEIARQLAGLVLKNTLSGTDRKIDKTKQTKWLAVPPDVAAVVKQNAFETLSSDCDRARGAACQVISKIGRVEVPTRAWSDLIPNLLNLVMNGDTHARKGSLTAFGYLCEDIQIIAEDIQKYEVISPDECNKILTAVVTGMKDGNPQIKLTATRALYHAVYFAYRNIRNEEERAYLLAAVAENVRYSEEKLVQQAAWECVIQIANEYYEFMAPFISELATLSLEAIRGGHEMTALPAVEFWNNICDEEIAIVTGLSDRPLLRFMSQAKEVLLPVLFEVMTKQTSEELDPNEWTLPMAAGTCVGLCAEVLRDDVLDLTLQFVNANFGHAEWQRREAAVFAYGSVMEGPTSERLGPLVQESFPTLCQRLEDTSAAVRDTTAWTVGRIAKFHFTCISSLLGTPERPGLINLLLQKLTDEPRVASQICFAINEIVDNGTNHGRGPVRPADEELALWARPLVQALYQVAHRTDADECKLRTAAYTALGEVISDLSGGRSDVCGPLFENLLHWLETSTVTIPISDEMSQLQIELCGCIERCLRVLDVPTVLPYAERCFAALLRVLYGGVVVIDGTSPVPFSLAAEDALMAINALAITLKERFAEFAPAFCKALHEGLEHRDDESLCEKCIDMAGDLSRALGKKFVGEHCRIIMSDLYLTLKDTTAKVALKPKAMQTIGDVAFNIGGEFGVHLEWSLDLLKQATQTRVEQGPMDNEEWLDFIQKLRDSVLWAYEGIFFGLRTDNKIQQLKIHVATMIEFIQLIIDDKTSSSSNQTKALELLCDLITAFPDVGSNLVTYQSDMYKKIQLLQASSACSEVQNQAKAFHALCHAAGVLKE